MRNKNMDIGDIIRFKTAKNKLLYGRIENTGRKNYRVLLPDGRFFLVPFRLAAKWEGDFAHPLPAPAGHVDAYGKQLVNLARQLLEGLDISLPVRYRMNVWATYYKKNSHIQFGGRCIRYQFFSGRGYDSISANINRFGLDFSLHSKLAVLVCHECAHVITGRKYNNRVRAHGKEFYHELSLLIDSWYPNLIQKLNSPKN